MVGYIVKEKNNFVWFTLGRLGLTVNSLSIAHIHVL